GRRGYHLVFGIVGVDDLAVLSSLEVVHFSELAVAEQFLAAGGCYLGDVVVISIVRTECERLQMVGIYHPRFFVCSSIQHLYIDNMSAKVLLEALSESVHLWFGDDTPVAITMNGCYACSVRQWAKKRVLWMTKERSNPRSQ
ncbi:hypothetical protein TNCV_3292251, partial [Trichonephila clavipes]